jgi:hypothetical protein
MSKSRKGVKNRQGILAHPAEEEIMLEEPWSATLADTDIAAGGSNLDDSCT